MSTLQKYSEVVKNFEFCDDFGEAPLLLGHVTTDRSIIAVVGLLGGFIAMVGLGFPGAAIVAFAVGNDLRYAANVEEEKVDESAPEPIASTERNGAIDVTAETVGDHSANAGNMVAAAPSMQVVNGVETIATSKVVEPDYLARIYQIIDRNNNFFIGGQPGSGKGVMVSNLIRRKLDKYPGSIAVYIDPKGSPREDGNFSDPRITRLKICGVGMSRAEYSIEVAEMLETARNFVDQCDIENGKHVWIVFDEIMNMKQKLSKDLFGEVQDLLVDCISMGDDQGLHTIALTQSFNAGDTVGSDELLKNLALIACFKEDDFPRAKKLVQYGKTNYDSYSTEEFSRLVRKSPRKRVICIGGTFIPAPEMPLLSGWDRDKGSKVNAPTPQATFQTTAIQDDPDDFSDLPDLFKAVAQMAIAAQTASDRSFILNDLNKAKANPLEARERLSKYNA
jgi:hypothetical protein